MDEQVVILRRDAPPPSICFKCGTNEGLSFVPFRFHVTPDESAAEKAAGAAGLAVSALGDAANVARLVRLIRETKEANVAIPLCAECAARWKRARVARVLAWMPGFTVLVAFIAHSWTRTSPLLGGGQVEKIVFIAAFSVAGWILFQLIPKLVEARVAERATCAPVAITPEWIALAHVHPRAVLEIETRRAPRELLEGLVE